MKEKIIEALETVKESIILDLEKAVNENQSERIIDELLDSLNETIRLISKLKNS